ncbi:hypothetical protein KXD40_009179 [Peronospora effusa]|uniref:FYVE-type domain-containing protein n=1 Tax=Peronospora effusa TaxID=542832 RepID=A0A3M6V7L9_9STRA|nr:hypothetical protein DD238_008038 [Peronospora effusa]UIZ25389.1 hypothetical protein KXD40_009179 [Peronospora effusa]CAI5707079.1 unnamed protein product [Peronospora effusa]
MANNYDNNFEHWLGPPLPTFERCPDGVQESRHLRRQSQQISGQRVRQSRQISKHIVGRALHPSDTVPSKQAYSPPAQQIPRSSQQIPAGFPLLQRHQSNKSASSDSNSNSSSESYIELSPTRRREIIIRVNEFVQCVMASMLSENASNVQWKPKFQKKDISYYVDETSVKPGQTRFCCVSRTHATVDEIMKLFVVSDADSMARTKRILSDSLLETQVLSVLRRPTKERQMNSMYVQYTSFRSPGLMAAREVCVAVATDMIHQSDGSTIGYCLWETVDGPEFEKATNKFEPSIMFRSGYFFRRSRQSTTGYPNESYTKIVYMVGLEHGGFSPGLTTKMLMEKSGTTVTRLCSHFRRKQLDSRTFVMKTEWTSKMSAKSCKQCERQLQVLSNRVNCHSCGHVMCRSCVSKELVELHAIGLVPMYICFSCLEKAKLPTRTMLQKTQTSLGRRRLQSDTTSIVGVTTRQALSKPQSYRQTRSVVDSKLVEEEDDEDSDTGEWAFTPSGIPVRPYRMAS